MKLEDKRVAGGLLAAVLGALGFVCLCLFLGWGAMADTEPNPVAVCLQADSPGPCIQCCMDAGFQTRFCAKTCIEAFRVSPSGIEQ